MKKTVAKADRLIEVGSIVKLRSDGPNMTVDSITDQDGIVKHPKIDQVACVWFDRDETLRRGVFRMGCLELAFEDE